MKRSWVVRRKGTLQGIHVLVTRPAGQAEQLCRMIRDRAGQPVEYPLFEIRPLSDAALLQSVTENAARYDKFIFISRNAVQFGLPLISAALEPRQELFAVGRSTAAAIIKAGLKTVHYPEHAGSEGLLAMPGLQEARVRGQRILIVRGRGGRELLARSLTERGARTDYAEVYERKPAWYDPQQELALWQDLSADIVLITSLDAIDVLVQRIPDAYKQKVLNANIVTMSERIAKHLPDSGFSQSARIARHADDEGIIKQCEEIAGSLKA
ncbi:MAG: uroporphyrinogen-III synthase [Thiotrichales bacterium]|nr:uroporphyrinogen-III synthase [Thiotrichales bacterium]